MPSFSVGSATDPSVSGNEEFRVSVYQPAPILPIHTTTSRRTNNLPPIRLIAESDKPVRPREAAAMKPQFTIKEPEVLQAPEPSDILGA